MLELKSMAWPLPRRLCLIEGGVGRSQQILRTPHGHCVVTQRDANAAADTRVAPAKIERLLKSSNDALRGRDCITRVCDVLKQYRELVSTQSGHRILLAPSRSAESLADCASGVHLQPRGRDCRSPV